MNDGRKKDTPIGVGPGDQGPQRPPPPPRGAGLSGTSPVGPRYDSQNPVGGTPSVKPLQHAVVRGVTDTLLAYDATAPAAPRTDPPAHGSPADARARIAELGAARTAVDPRVAQPHDQRVMRDLRSPQDLAIAQDLSALESRSQDPRAYAPPVPHAPHDPRAHDPHAFDPHTDVPRHRGPPPSAAAFHEPHVAAEPQVAAARGAFGAPPRGATIAQPNAQPPLRAHEAPRTSFDLNADHRMPSQRPTGFGGERSVPPAPPRPSGGDARSARPGASGRPATRSPESLPASGRAADPKPGLRLKLGGETGYGTREIARVPKRRGPLIVGLLIAFAVFGGGGAFLWLQGHGGAENFLNRLQGAEPPTAQVPVTAGTETTTTPPGDTPPGTAPPAAATPAPAADPTAAAAAQNSAAPTQPAAPATAPATAPTPSDPGAAQPAGAAPGGGAEEPNAQIATGEVETPEQAAAAAPEKQAQAQAAPTKPKPAPKPAVRKPPVKRQPVMRIREETDPSAIFNAPPPDPSGGEAFPPPDPPAP